MRILIVASDEPATSALRALLARIDPDCHVEVADHDAAWRSPLPATRSIRPDLVLVDVDTDPTDSGATIAGCLRSYPRARLVALGSRVDDIYVGRILEAGALGYLPKSHSETIALGVLRLVLSDASYRPPSSSSARKKSAVASVKSVELAAHATGGTPNGFHLTGRQVEVLALAAQGKTNQTIAKHLGISEGTTKLHMTAIYKSLNVQNRAEAVLLASRMQDVHFTQIKEVESGMLDLDWLLPHMTHRRVPRGTILFRQGDAGAELWYLQRGTIHLEEIDMDVGSGAVFGEIGIFSPSHERTCTAVCATDVDLFTLTSEQVKRLYLLNPQFALYLVHLVAKRLMADRSRVI